MLILLGILTILGLLFYIAAGLAAVNVICTYDDFFDKKERKRIILVSLIVIIAPLVAYFIRDYAERERNLIKFNNSFETVLSNNSEDSKKRIEVERKFKEIDKSNKDKFIEQIYFKLYSNDLNSKAEFIDNYEEYNLKFVDIIKKELQDSIQYIYLSKANSQNPDWSNFSNLVPIKLFLSKAPNNILEREFSHWNTDESAWQRVLLIDSIELSKIYLERFPKGNHVYDAKKIILDDSFKRSNGLDKTKITSNYDGTTTISVNNNSTYEVTVHYSGNFADGSVKVPGNTYRNIQVPNGYYHISISSQKLHTRSINERITCDGGVIPYDLELKQDFRRR